MNYEAIASEILGQGRQTEADELDIENTVAILRAHEAPEEQV
jgi:hypothetical protein